MKPMNRLTIRSLKRPLAVLSCFATLSTAATLVTSLVTFLATPPAHARGGETSGGGDGITVDGRLVLRDFLDRSHLVADNAAFLESIDGLMPLLQDIGAVHAPFALAIWKDLTRAQIFLTDDELSLLPPEQTGISKVIVPEEQIAIREKNTILISLPALNRLGDQRPYLLLHESLHGLMKGEGPMHHVRVRGLVKHLQAERSRLELKTLVSVLERFGILLLHPERSGHDAQEADFQITRILMKGEGSFETRCAIIQDVTLPYSLRYMGIRTFGEYRSCPKSRSYSALFQLFPDLKKVEEGARRLENFGAIYSYNLVPTGLLKRSEALKSCNEFATAAYGKTLQVGRADQTLRFGLRDTIKNFKSPESPELELYVQQVAGNQTEHYSLNLYDLRLEFQWASGLNEPDFEKLEPIYVKNQATCQKLFKGNSRDGWRR